MIAARIQIAGVLVLGCVSQQISGFAQSSDKGQKEQNPAIRIIAASFGDQVNGNTCTPDLSICNGVTKCSFTVGEMCDVKSSVKNLEVTWDCGEGTAKKARAAAKGTPISLDCATKSTHR